MSHHLLKFALLMFLADGCKTFRFALRVCFKDIADQEIPVECAYCNPKKLKETMIRCTMSADGVPVSQVGTNPGIPIYHLVSAHANCILEACRSQYPKQKVLSLFRNFRSKSEVMMV